MTETHYWNDYLSEMVKLSSIMIGYGNESSMSLVKTSEITE